MIKHVAPPPVADINVTPMVDVMLVMLIIFMVITPMLTKGVSVDMVRTKNPVAMQAADKTDAVIVAVTRDGKTYLGNNQVAADRWRRRLRTCSATAWTTWCFCGLTRVRVSKK
jgi:biopolymer transport protein ExbD/biopolymer transport protein TolR